MANIFQEISGFLKNGAADIVKAVAWLGTIGSDFEKVVKAGVAVVPATLSSLVVVINDVENLALLTSGSVGAGGLNFPEDSAAFKAFEQLLSDLKPLGSQLKADVIAIEAALQTPKA